MSRFKKRNTLAYAAIFLSAVYLLSNIFSSRSSSACHPSAKPWFSLDTHSDHSSAEDEVFGPGKRSRIEWGKQVPRTKAVRSKSFRLTTEREPLLISVSRLSGIRGIRQSVRASGSLLGRLRRQDNAQRRANRHLSWRAKVPRSGWVSRDTRVWIIWNRSPWNNSKHFDSSLAGVGTNTINRRSSSMTRRDRTAT